MAFGKFCIAALLGAGFWLAVSEPIAASDVTTAARSGGAALTDFSAQERPVRRARTRIEVYPRRSYLGRNARRDCVSWLEPEWRPSGTVIMPRLRCWWVQG